MYLLLDTDIGDDIDDFLTIGLILKKQLNLVGVTTVYREANARASIVKNFFEYVGCSNIPVYAGYSKPISEKSRALGKLNYGTGVNTEIEYNQPEEAVDFIIDCAKRYGKELTLLAIGAQTNIAKAYQKAPKVMSGIGKLVIMGAAFFIHNDEWNIACDPMAAKIVSESNMPITYVAWDVTKLISIGNDNNEYILNNTFDKIGERVAENVRAWFKNSKYEPLLHDPAALYYCIMPEKFTERKVRVKFVAEGELTGMSLNLDTFTGLVKDKQSYPLVNVVVGAKSDEIVRDFMNTLFDKRII